MSTTPQRFKIDDIDKDAFAIHALIGRFSSEWHCHHTHKLLYAEDGVLHLYSEQYQLLLPSRHAAWIPCNWPHRVVSKSPTLYWRTLYFRATDSDHPLLSRLHLFPIPNLAREMILYTQTWSVEDEPDEIETSFFQAIRHLIPDWCQNALPLILPATEQPQLLQITIYIQENLADPLTLTSVAHHYGFSGRTLLRLFKRELGLTFGTYLRIARIIRALEVLMDADSSVTEVAYAVGYDSPSAFTRTFRALVGVNPQTYVQEHVLKGGHNR